MFLSLPFRNAFSPEAYLQTRRQECRKFGAAAPFFADVSVYLISCDTNAPRIVIAGKDDRRRARLRIARFVSTCV
jgi:hypothetical protein